MNIKVDVMVPFAFCEDCPQMEVETIRTFDFETGKTIKAERRCSYTYGCIHAIKESYERSKTNERET